MREISIESYVKNICDYEKLYLILIDYDKVFLCADIENEENLRIEMMYFEMDTSLNFFESNSECRGRYSGGIYFIEYDSEEEAQKNIVKDFMSIQDDGEEIYLLCNENELEDILKNYPHKAVYVMSTKNFTS